MGAKNDTEELGEGKVDKKVTNLPYVSVRGESFDRYGA